MIFSGGEPLMRTDIFDLVKYARSLGLKPVFGTNGTSSTGSGPSSQGSGNHGYGNQPDSMDPAKHDELRQYQVSLGTAVAGMDHCRAVNLPFQIHTTIFD